MNVNNNLNYNFNNTNNNYNNINLNFNNNFINNQSNFNKTTKMNILKIIIILILKKKMSK